MGDSATALQTNPPTAAPRYAVGDIKGQFEVDEYLGYSTMNPSDGRHLAKRQHWYEVACSCGERETINQAQLNNRGKCLECTAIDKSQKVSLQRRARSSLPKGVPNFATMKLRGV